MHIKFGMVFQWGSTMHQSTRRQTKSPAYTHITVFPFHLNGHGCRWAVKPRQTNKYTSLWNQFYCTNWTVITSIYVGQYSWTTCKYWQRLRTHMYAYQENQRVHDALSDRLSFPMFPAVTSLIRERLKSYVQTEYACWSVRGPTYFLSWEVYSFLSLRQVSVKFCRIFQLLKGRVCQPCLL